MRTILWTTLVSLGMAVAASTGSGAPVNGTVMGGAVDSLATIDQVHCRKYPHRHKKADPHGWGFGCPKKSGTKGPQPKSDDAPK